MVKRALTFFTKEIRGLHEAAYLLGASALASQLLAVVRDRVFAHYFGASETLDIYFAAFKIPDFIFISAASIVSASVLVPYLVKKRAEGEEEYRTFISMVGTMFSFIIGVLALAAFILMPYIVPRLFPGLSHVSETIVLMSRIMLASPICLGFSNFFGSIAQAERRFMSYALAPVLYNAGIIVGAVVLRESLGIYGLAWGVALGALLHALVQYAPLIGSRSRYPFGLTVSRSFFSVMRMSVPRTFALGLSSLTVLVLTSLASAVGEGAIAVFTLALNLQSVPLTIIGSSYSLAAFPTLSKLATQGDREGFAQEVIISARHIIWWSLPIIGLFIILRAHIVRTVFGSGMFDWNDTRLTAAILATFVVSAAAQSLILLFTRAWYAASRTALPLNANALGTLVSIVLGFSLTHAFVASLSLREAVEALFRIEGVPGSQVVMLGIAYSLGSFVTLILLVLPFFKAYSVSLVSICKTFVQSGLASVALMIVSYIGLQWFGPAVDQTSLVGIFLQGLSAGVMGIVTWALILVLLKNTEFKDVFRTLTHAVWKRVPRASREEEHVA